MLEFLELFNRWHFLVRLRHAPNRLNLSEFHCRNHVVKDGLFLQVFVVGALVAASLPRAVRRRTQADERLETLQPLHDVVHLPLLGEGVVEGVELELVALETHLVEERI